MWFPLSLNFCLPESYKVELQQPCLNLSPTFSVLMKYGLAYCCSQIFNCEAVEYSNVYIYVTIQYYHYQSHILTNYRDILVQLCLILYYKCVAYYTDPTKNVSQIKDT
jgi:uncharacterized membrane protein YoaT (DUF817 family)